MDLSTTGTRRDRQRAATVAEIKAAARKLLVEGGASAVGLRAVARELGLSAPALYRYFASHEDLISAVIADLYDELTAVLVALRDEDAEADLGTRLFLVAGGLRDWALAHPAEFGLLFGAPVPNPLADGHELTPNHQAAMRFGAVFKDLVAQVWHQQPFPSPSDESLGPELVAQLQQKSEYFDGMPAGAVYLALNCWTRLYGLICMEVFGQLHWALEDAGAYFQAQLYEIGEALGLDCPPPG
ncbi:TetR family transcriptional regulator [Kribbella orskensis]|uniref:TetR family transcriptional regulator n=1 Tax=Kribbella orskensis TaxID=2512216 RepID=A0ABY2BA44_9ACTN|nr:MULTISPECIES: TetR/AcrR family transcriptional regulator [Kribbella]TCN29985.1 TetR family transcriptional regulator [Kribbella sp. VKM Ac-2500]TCO10103.1 TetR family transcriptional regulator [Kribbella orskensis]